MKNKIEMIEGLWKFDFPLPRYGLLKGILELNPTGDNENPIDCYLCLNDQFESNFYRTSWNAKEDEFQGKVRILGFDLLFTLQIAEQNFSGSIKCTGLSTDIRGHRIVFGKPQTSLDKQSFENYKEELKTKEKQTFHSPSENEIKGKVEALLEKMTLDEKIGQMYQMSGHGNVTGPDADLSNSEDLIKEGKVGSVLGVTNALQTYGMQKIAVEKSRLGIPLMFMADVIHGLRTIFPIPLAMASSWDMEVIEKANKVAAKESSVAGIHLTFAPMVDIGRDPRWGRVMEGAGEDPYLGYCCAQAHVKGFQGEKISDGDSIIACVKHYAAYGGAEGGRDYNTVDMSEYRLRNFYLPPYKGAVDAGVGCLMTSFNCILGRPATGNKKILTDILRDEWKFGGMTISDYNSVIEMIAHGTASNMKDAALDALKSGLDIEMVSQAYLTALPELVKSGKVSEDLIDGAVRRILYYKYKIGLFEDPYHYMDLHGEESLHICDKHRDIARYVAKRSMVLLKNAPYGDQEKPILPLSNQTEQTLKKIAVIGPFGDEGRIIGSWSASGDSRETVSLLDGMSSKVRNINNTDKEDKVFEIMYSKGCSIKGTSTKGFADAKSIAQEADIIVLALGEDERMSGEAKSRAHISLPGIQEKLAREISSLGKPTILVLFNGRPLVIPWFKENMNAILEAWMPGTEGGNAIADILFGDYNPSGKLTMSFPLTEGQIPVYYNHYTTGRPALNTEKSLSFKSNYLDIPNEPLYPFGYGLSYSQFTYENLQLSSNMLDSDSSLEVSVVVKNLGAYGGEEVVQLYVQDVVGSMVRPVKMLKGFKKISLKPQEQKKVSFTIQNDTLSYYLPADNSCEFELKAEPGQFKVFVGSSSRDEDLLEESFVLQK